MNMQENYYQQKLYPLQDRVLRSIETLETNTKLVLGTNFGKVLLVIGKILFLASVSLAQCFLP
jgi:hypothetical protein